MPFPKVRCVEPPTALPVDLETLKNHVRVDLDDTEDDNLILSYLRASVRRLDGRDGLFYCLSPQTWAQDVTFDGCDIRLPLGPIIEILSVKYTDANGNQVTIDPADYRLIPATGTDDAVLERLASSRWPVGRNGVITYRAGAEVVDDAIQIALCMMVADLYRLRESQAREEPKLNPTVTALLYPFNRSMVT